MTDIDALMRDSFARIVVPGDPAGVADAIRARVDAGDPGTPAETSGFAASGGWLAWLPWVGIVVATGLVGFAVAQGGYLAPQLEPPTQFDAAFVLAESVPAANCPGGDTVTTLPAGTRVLAVARSKDSSWLGVRDTSDLLSTVWLPANAVTPDAGQSVIGELAVATCPTVTFVHPEPEPEASEAPDDSPTPTPTPTKPKPTPPKSDNAKPAIVSLTAAPDPIYNLEPALVRVTATDNVGVASVRISWTGEFTGSANMTKVGGEWRYTFTPTDDTGGDIVFTVRAKDAAGNQSATATTTIAHQFFG